MSTRTRWTEAELLIALNLYHKLTFGQMHARQPLIVEVAAKLGRNANSLAMKLCNLASLDPALKLRGIKGLSGASALDQSMWDRFHAEINEFAPASEEAFRKLYAIGNESEIDVIPKRGVIVRMLRAPTSTESLANVRVRRGQEFFREAVINNFDGRCGVSQLGVRELLIASHILPWSSHPAERLNVRNGLCLSRVHDAAFDQGLITFDDSLQLVLSKGLRDHLSESIVDDLFGKFEGKVLHLPDDAALPELGFLATHRKSIFRKAS
ncbi:MAG: HNH endonuclease [Verrucomicrobiaceae bacterium]|nr:HNH endonuclease [Verrucomicrobiaceae bacterium]